MEYGITAFFATLAVYNFQRLYKLKSAITLSPWLIWVKTHRTYLIVLCTFSTVIALIGFILLIDNFVFVLPILILALIISFFYVVPIFGKSLREIPFIKSPLIALIWTIILIVFPWVNEYGFVDSIFAESLAYFYFTLGLTIPFDIRDLKYDKESQKTSPQIIGIKRSKLFAAILIILYLVIIAIINQYMRNNLFFYVAVAFCIFLVFYTKEKRKEAYYALLDASILLVGLTYFLV